MNENEKTPLGVLSPASTCVGDNCVEVAALPGGLIGIRDFKNSTDAATALRPRRREAPRQP